MKQTATVDSYFREILSLLRCQIFESVTRIHGLLSMPVMASDRSSSLCRVAGPILHVAVRRLFSFRRGG